MQKESNLRNKLQRDKIALEVLKIELSKIGSEFNCYREGINGTVAQDLADDCYFIADAMITASEGYSGK